MIFINFLKHIIFPVYSTLKTKITPKTKKVSKNRSSHGITTLISCLWIDKIIKRYKKKKPFRIVSSTCESRK